MKPYIIAILISMIIVCQATMIYGDEVEGFELGETDLFMNHGTVMLIINPESGVIVYANKAAADFYGYQVDHLIGMNINEFNMLTPDEVQAEMALAKNEERNYFNFKHLAAGGLVKDVEVYSYPVTHGGETHLFSVIIDISYRKSLELERVQLLEGREATRTMIIVALSVGLLLMTLLLIRYISLSRKLRFLTYHDTLTGLNNRKNIVKDYNQFIKDSEIPLCMVVIDINHLKFVNDTYGHQAGDEMIKAVADFLDQKAVRGAKSYRISGDEFVLLLPECAENYGQQLEEDLKSFKVPIQGCNFDISLGMATIRNATTKFEKMFSKAEQDMYSYKSLNKPEASQRIIDQLRQMVIDKSPDFLEREKKVTDLCHYFVEALSLDGSINRVIETGVKYQNIGLSLDMFTNCKHLGEDPNHLTKHAEKGYAILHALGKSQTICNTVLYHHEYMDGTGYPKGLVGEEIPLSSRILCIANYIVEKASDKPLDYEAFYKTAIEEQAHRFDKRLVGACLSPAFEAIYESL